MTTMHHSGKRNPDGDARVPRYHVYPLRETGKPLRHELAVWVAPGVRRKLRIPERWTTTSEAERDRFARGAVVELRDQYREECRQQSEAPPKDPRP